MATCGQTRGKKKKNQKDEPERSGKNSLIIGRRRPLRPRAWPRPQATGCSLGVLLVARLHPRGQRRVKAEVFSLPFHFFFVIFFYFCILQNHLP